MIDLSSKRREVRRRSNNSDKEIQNDVSLLASYYSGLNTKTIGYYLVGGFFAGVGRTIEHDEYVLIVE